jgi:hypothetical protein
MLRTGQGICFMQYSGRELSIFDFILDNKLYLEDTLKPFINNLVMLKEYSEYDPDVYPDINTYPSGATNILGRSDGFSMTGSPIPTGQSDKSSPLAIILIISIPIIIIITLILIISLLKYRMRRQSEDFITAASQ